eukprot:CAMPEP_0177524034 /NCGR_PEP_ID=MMETSP0369-20130122/49735_1 /TAXON_ID=447022 ORGANISM="Scrippsiella hangoei-like, Strain SHHI-4" /NCGR_SAMPLE_ID=MMETSP0369 /ASSEMBLY_ACC=CAM_ASM_000364 /LENGTH=102 /DNA_ID=CAMNT_0019003965 /DNA_START=106 /DNA_END=414 /DNA_ORIENTATION=+
MPGAVVSLAGSRMSLNRGCSRASVTEMRVLALNFNIWVKMSTASASTCGNLAFRPSPSRFAKHLMYFFASSRSSSSISSSVAMPMMLKILLSMSCLPWVWYL